MKEFMVTKKQPEPLRGVNLGGWLVLERWITPSLFTGLKAKDEYGFCRELGDEAAGLLEIHRQHFITRDDFKWLAEHGLNAVRLPVGYWILEDTEPYIGGIEYVDRAFAWAREFRIQILLDLHGAPGSQNGHDHSGRIGPVAWTDEANLNQTLGVLEALAKRYGSHSNLWGIELLNEPSWRIGKRRLREFYEAGYAAVRKHCGTNVVVVVPDAYHPKRWKRTMQGEGFQSRAMDVHLYQVFGKKDKRRNASGVLAHTLAWSKLLKKVGRHWPIVVGEWSVALNGSSLKGLPKEQIRQARRAYAATQLLAFEQTEGWFYWTYRTETMDDWSYRRGVEKGWLPSDFS